jgi:hypothetical protein
MDAFAQSSPEDRRAGFVQTAAARRLDPIIVEKDFWVCWTLKELFRLPEIGEHLIFKGGTSLSKVFRIIERFSEDIDVSIDRGWLGFGGANEPEAGASKKEKQRRDRCVEGGLPAERSLPCCSPRWKQPSVKDCGERRSVVAARGR